MTKKIWIALVLITLSFTITGCGDRQSSKAAMQIEPAKLTEQESQIVQLVQGDHHALFDYVINSDVKSVSVVCYKLDENGKWVVNSEGNFPLNDTSGRMALSFEKLGDGFRIAVQEGANMTANENKSGEKIDTEGMSSAVSYASAESIEYEKEIPLAIQMFTSKNEIFSCGVGYFNNPEEYQKREYDDVYVIVAKFSRNELRR